ncbi:MAG TPA: DUF4880 domain-containing protein [Rhizomicrobium sp.]|jgi:ferric-dicitrate binding protein FerR (iron transport regulator)|nr:DUF4880 domain-containing protein [Rhizomicrobium sp.]
MNTEDEAARWFAVLHRGVMTLQERREYQAWMASRAHRVALRDAEQLWTRVGSTNRPSGASAGRRMMMLATLCAISLGFVVLAWTSHSAFWTGLDWTNR